MPRRSLLLAASVILVPMAAVASWVVIDTVVHETGDAAFCGGCHTMTPMVNAWREDLHGGAARHGAVAECIDCHVPHDNAVVYLWGKTRAGARDVWATLTRDPAGFDWQARRAHREDYVYDSGCLECHVGLEQASQRRAVTFVAHRPYFLGRTQKQCVSCHARVGHSDLSRHLSEFSFSSEG